MNSDEMQSIQQSLRQTAIDQARNILSFRSFNETDQPTVAQVIEEAKRIMLFINTGN